MYLNENEKQEISKEIEKLEEKSSAELVAVITKSSSTYKFESLFLAIIITTFISSTTLLFEISSVKFFQTQILSFLSFYFIFQRYEKTILTFLPKSYKYNKCSIYANNQFINLGLQTTKSKQAIMFFVSFDEKYVQIITDSKIKEKIENKYWKKIVDEFTNDVKNKDISNGYLKAIKSCNKILIDNFPIKEDDENELSNEIIELK